MTRTLELAIERLRQMPEDRQDSLAKLLLHEIDEDDRWMRSTADHADKLRRLVDNVLDADHKGECETLDPERL
jgi:hypothetical protein